MSKTKTKVITTANQNKGMRTQSKRVQPGWSAENSSDQVAIGFGFASDWLRGWREFCRPITQRSKAKPMQSRITFDTQLKIALTAAIADSRHYAPLINVVPNEHLYRFTLITADTLNVLNNVFFVYQRKWFENRTFSQITNWISVTMQSTLPRDK